MRRRQVTVIPGGPLGLVGWGLGWALKNWDGCPLYGHDGATLGQYAFLRVEPRSGVAMVLLTNGGFDAENHLARISVEEAAPAPSSAL